MTTETVVVPALTIRGPGVQQASAAFWDSESNYEQ